MEYMRFDILFDVSIGKTGDFCKENIKYYGLD